ncbi:glycosyltransferase family 4 protein [soil metagenome]
MEAFPIPQEHATGRKLADHALSILSRKAYTLRTYSSRAYRARIGAVLAERRPDLVHLDSLDLASYLPLFEGLPVVCTHHNIESKLLRRRAESRAYPLRGYLALQADWVAEVEQYWCPRVALNVTVSDQDGAELLRLAPGSRVEVIPNGVDTARFQPRRGSEDGIAFVGGANWFPNTDALDFFTSEILPLIRAGGANPRVRWIGRSSPAQQAHFASKAGIELTGYVDDWRPFVADAACYVVPLRVGGGTRLKILDAWAMGKAVVSTSVGCEGLEARDGDNILIRDTPEAFAQAVGVVLRDTALRSRLGESARRTVEQHYGWDSIGEKMNRLYRALATWSEVLTTARDERPRPPRFSARDQS